jgi:proteasome lid subunit RPN8/RPN11
MTTAKRRLIEEAERVNPVLPVHIWRPPAGAAVDMLVVTHLSAYSVIHQHASEALPNETGGFLIGRVAHDHRDGCWHLEIEEALPMEPSTQNPMHFTFTWRDVDRVRSYREEHGKALIGWYHTHPDLGIFLSETDLERTHRVLFSEPFQIALVYDPVRRRAGYFFWEGAQTIDAGLAEWREFDISVTPDHTDGEVATEGPGPGDTPPIEAGAPTAPPAPQPAVATPTGGTAAGGAQAVSSAASSAPAAVAAVEDPAAAPNAATSETQIRRLRIASTDGEAPGRRSLASEPASGMTTASMLAARALEPAAPRPRSVWPLVGLCIAILLTGLALGYLLFGAGGA